MKLGQRRTSDGHVEYKSRRFSFCSVETTFSWEKCRWIKSAAINLMATSLEAAIGVSVSRELDFLFVSFPFFSLCRLFLFFLRFHSLPILLFASFSFFVRRVYTSTYFVACSRTYMHTFARRERREYRLTRSSSSLDFSFVIINAVIIDCDLCVHANFQCCLVWYVLGKLILLMRSDPFFWSVCNFLKIWYQSKFLAKDVVSRYEQFIAFSLKYDLQVRYFLKIDFIPL